MKFITVNCLTILFSFLLLFGNDYQIDFAGSPGGIYELNLQVDAFKIQKTSVSGNSYSEILFDAAVFTEQEGYARLPYVSSALILPALKNVDIEILAGQYEDISLSDPLLPSRGIIYRNQDPSQIPYQVNPASITDSWYPGQLADNSRPFIIKDVRGSSVYFYPFQYNAAQNILRIYKSIQVRLTENDDPADNPLLKQSSTVLREMGDLYRSVFLNYTESTADLDYGQYGDILVITTARDEQAIEPYILWKREKGHNVSKEVVATGTHVKDLIQQKYDENNNFLYVQLVGDWQDIQCDLGTSSNLPMDPQLGCVAGNDYFADISVGRISAASTADVTIQVDKIINYEKASAGPAGWYSKATAIASQEGPGDDNERDYEHLDVIWNDKLNPFTYTGFNDIYEPSANKTMVNDALSAGTGLINYTGHGSLTSWSTTGFSNSDISSLTNAEKLPAIISVACNNGEFNAGSDCFSETWLKQENGGAVIMLGATISQPWDPPMRGQDYFMDILTGGYDYDAHSGQSGINTSGQRSTFGSIVINGFSLMLSESNSSSDLETVQTWTIFGDPTLQLRTKDPAALNLSNGNVYAGIDFTTTVSAGDPVEGAMVTLSQDGNYFSGITNSNGQVTITHELLAGPALLVVSAFNTETIYREINAASADGPSITVSSFSVNDSLSGNGSGAADFNESVLLNVAAQNIGNEAALAVSAILSVGDIHADITGNSHFYGDFSVQQSISGDDVFALTVSDSVPDQHIIPLSVTFTDSENEQWTSDINITANAPMFAAGELTTDDQASGNGDGKLDASESADLHIVTINSGHADAAAVTGRLSEESDFLSISEPEVDLGPVSAGDTVIAVFPVTVSGDAPNGTAVDVYFKAYSGQYAILDTFTLIIGELPVYTMTDTTCYVRHGMFFDSGGENSNYQNREALVMTFLPADRSPSVKAAFSSFELEEGSDYLHIYDGSSMYADEVPGSPFTGSATPDEIVATNPEGALTFLFRSNMFNTSAGWSAEVFSTVISGLENEPPSAVAGRYKLLANYPNPFNPETIIPFQLAEKGHVRLQIFNSLGENVRTLINGQLKAGEHKIRWDGLGNKGGKLSSGVYFYRLQTQSHSSVRKMLLIK